jgi:hypothetical protein
MPNVPSQFLTRAQAMLAMTSQRFSSPRRPLLVLNTE